MRRLLPRAPDEPWPVRRARRLSTPTDATDRWEVGSVEESDKFLRRASDVPSERQSGILDTLAVNFFCGHAAPLIRPTAAPPLIPLSRAHRVRRWLGRHPCGRRPHFHPRGCRSATYELFLKSACCAASASTWRGRGTRRLPFEPHEVDPAQLARDLATEPLGHPLGDESPGPELAARRWPLDGRQQVRSAALQ